MPFYRCLNRGEGFPGSLIGVTGTTGFFTTRFVKADDASAAEQAVLNLLRQDPLLLSSRAERPRQATVYCDEVIEVSAEVASQTENEMGFTFFAGESEASDA